MDAQLRRRRAPEPIRLRAAHGHHARHRLGGVFRAEGAVLAEQEAEVAAHFSFLSGAREAVLSQILRNCGRRSAPLERVVAAKNLYRVLKSPSFAVPPKQQRF